MKIAIIANSGWYLYNFRRNLMQALRAAGHDILAVSAADRYVDRLCVDGVVHAEFPLAPAGTNPLVELRTVLALRRILKAHQVTLALTYTPKANIYTGLIARGLGIGHVPNVSGLGHAFVGKSALQRIVVPLYRHAFRPAHLVLFQNDADRAEFLRLELVLPQRTGRVPGSGVDLTRFSPQPPRPDRDGRCVFLFVGRVLGDKGIQEFVAAAREVRRLHANVDFQILGSLEAANPSSISIDLFNQWVRSGLITYLGSSDDVRDAMATADCIVLPSYREGVSRSLLEAAAMGKPCIATDVPGCREAVEHRRNGLLCVPRSSEALTAALLEFLQLPESDRYEMGRQGRMKMEHEFDERIVLDIYSELVAAFVRGRGDPHDLKGRTAVRSSDR